MRRRNASRRGTRARTCAAAVAALICAVATSTGVAASAGDAAAATSPAFTVSSPSVGANVAAVANDSTTHRVYLANRLASTVTVIDGLTRTVTSTFAVPEQPEGFAIDPTRHLLAVVGRVGASPGHSGTENVSLVDTSTNTVTTTIVTTLPFDAVFIDAQTKRLFTSESVYDAPAKTYSRVWDGNGALTVAGDSALTQVYVANPRTGTLDVVSSSTLAVLTAIDLGGFVNMVAVDTAAHRVYATENTAFLSIINGTSRTLTSTLPLPFIPTALGVDSRAHLVYASAFDGQTAVIDGLTNQIVATVTASAYPGPPAVDTSTGAVWEVDRQHETVTVIDPVVSRRAGVDRINTATAVSTAAYDQNGADAVVLARADTYPDALVGAPLAAKMNAPLLYTAGTTLPPATQAELQRVLAPGKTVDVLGGTSAIPASIAAQLTALGYTVVRVSGQDRYATAVAVADLLGDPTTVFLATSANFADALAAGPASAKVNGAILLTNGTAMSAAASDYLAARPGTAYAIGGAAAAADPAATPIVGADRYATAAMVAQQFFASASTVGVASGTTFADALPASAFLGHAAGPLLLTDPAALPAAPAAYLQTIGSGVTKALVFGGTAAVGAAVQAQLTTALGH